MTAQRRALVVAAVRTPMGRFGGSLSRIRVLVTLVHGMRRRGTRYGIAALCVGAGQGIATLVRNLDALWTSAPLASSAGAG